MALYIYAWLVSLTKVLTNQTQVNTHAIRDSHKYALVRKQTQWYPFALHTPIICLCYLTAKLPCITSDLQCLAELFIEQKIQHLCQILAQKHSNVLLQTEFKWGSELAVQKRGPSLDAWTRRSAQAIQWIHWPTNLKWLHRFEAGCSDSHLLCVCMLALCAKYLDPNVQMKTQAQSRSVLVAFLQRQNNHGWFALWPAAFSAQSDLTCQTGVAYSFMQGEHTLTLCFLCTGPISESMI